MNRIVTLFSLVWMFLLCSQGAQAQFKNVHFDPNVKIAKEKTRLLNKVNITSSSAPVAGNLDFQPLNSSVLNALKSGLKPGLLNDKKIPTYIEGKLKNSGKRGASTESLAYEYVGEAAPLMRINQADEEFKITKIETDDLNITHVRMQQFHNNVPIYGAEIIVHGEGQAFDFLNGSYFPSSEKTNEIPTWSESQALQVVKNDLNSMVDYSNDISKVGTMKTVSELVYYPIEDQLKLAYHLTTYKNIIDRWEYFIDAQTGNLLNKYTSICKFHNHQHTKGEPCHQYIENESTKEASTTFGNGPATANAQDLFGNTRLINTYEVSSKYYMIDGSRDIFASSPAQLPNDPAGVIWTIDAFNTSPANNNFNYDHVTSSNNSWSSKTAVSAHFNGGKAFEYYQKVHSRKSINGSGGNIVSLINVADEDGSSMGNAFWNGEAMFYGNGDNSFQPLARGLDVAGHEMTHGVVQSTANLDYEGESGALNESFADVFGVLIDRDDWKIGEDVVKSGVFPFGALRNMEDPHNGASTNNFNAGWQPRHVNEKYKGSEDNGGVHINSGIPNWAFYKFASAVGKDKAERVYYQALTKYLTKSSQFIDCRVAVVKAATDLYSTAEINAAKKAFDEVGILGDTGGNYETDINNNPGQEFILTTGSNNAGLFVYTTTGTNLGQISTKNVLSKPSISDDGSEIVFVGTDNKMYYITIDWTQNPVTPKEQVLSSEAVWRNAIISKDGLKIAATTTEEINEIYVFYFGGQQVTQKVFELYNPTFTQGVTTGDVNFADAMEFDLTGQEIMYDAENEIKSNTAGSIVYFDISFVQVFNNATKNFANGKIDKLYSSLPEDVSIGNPTFSKNSPYIIAFDYIDPNGDASVVAANIESGAANLIYENNTLGYPNYSSKDDKLVFDNEGSTSINTGVVTLTSSKINPSSNPTLFIQGKRWAVWFSNGKRNLSDIKFEENLHAGFEIKQNPVSDLLSIKVNGDVYNKTNLSITDVSGHTLVQKNFDFTNDATIIELSVSDLNAGIYFVTLQSGVHANTLKFIKK